VTPPGVWNRKARDLALARGFDDARTIRLFASLNVAMMDSFIACWRSKFQWWTVRPVNAIREKKGAPSGAPQLSAPTAVSRQGRGGTQGVTAYGLGKFLSVAAAAFR
jgi:hypothetical protein